MKIVVVGDGAMGEVLQKQAQKMGIKILGVVGFCKSDSIRSIFAVSETPDCVIDFSHRDMLKNTAEYCLQKKVPLVVATTGLQEIHQTALDDLSKSLPVCQCDNFSRGMSVFEKLFLSALKYLPDCDVELSEIHHSKKADAPGGTTKSLMKILKSVRPEANFVFDGYANGARQKTDVGITIKRGGTECGIHKAYFFCDGETLTINHTAQTKSIFAIGALTAAHALVGKQCGFYNFSALTEQNCDG